MRADRADASPQAGFELSRRRTPRPVFIIGAPRSGTSVTTWVLGQHPNIQPMPETCWIASMAVGAYLSYLKGSERGRFSHLSNVEYPLEPFLHRVGESIDDIVRDVFDTRCRRSYGPWRETGRLRQGKKADPRMQLLRQVDDPKERWIDGTPLNTYYLWILGQVFPGARFIHNLRTPREVAASLEGFDRVGADPQPLEQGLQTWAEHTENAWFAERAFGKERVFRLDFKRIADDPEALFRDVLAFLGEPWAPECLQPLERKLNSSQVDDRHPQAFEALQGIANYRMAEELYARIVASPVGEGSDAEALGVLHQRFLDYCKDRAIV